MTQQTKHIWLQIIKLVLGAWLIIGNWIFLFADSNPMLVPNLIIGAIFVLMAILNLIRVRKNRPLVGGE